jgi:hypothetical protein
MVEYTLPHALVGEQQRLGLMQIGNSGGNVGGVLGGLDKMMSTSSDLVLVGPHFWGVR